MLGKCQVAPPSETGSRAEAQRAGEAASPVSTQEGQRHRGRHARCPFWAGWQRDRQEEQP